MGQSGFFSSGSHLTPAYRVKIMVFGVGIAALVLIITRLLFIGAESSLSLSNTFSNETLTMSYPDRWRVRTEGQEVTMAGENGSCHGKQNIFMEISPWLKPGEPMKTIEDAVDTAENKAGKDAHGHKIEVKVTRQQIEVDGRPSTLVIVRTHHIEPLAFLQLYDECHWESDYYVAMAERGYEHYFHLSAEERDEGKTEDLFWRLIKSIDFIRPLAVDLSDEPSREVRVLNHTGLQDYSTS